MHFVKRADFNDGDRRGRACQESSPAAIRSDAQSRPGLAIGTCPAYAEIRMPGATKHQDAANLAF
jgi:hypothetical protein